MKTHSAEQRQLHTVPVALALQLVEVVKRWHIPAGELLSEVGLHEGVLEDPLDRLPLKVMCDLLESARTLTGEPGLGYYLGLDTKVTMYGYLGFAALSASTVREALALAVAFAPLFSTALTMDLQIEGGRASLRLEENADLGSARDIVLISMLLGLSEIGRALTGRNVENSLDLTIPEPEYYGRFAHLAPNSHFGQPVNRMSFAAAALDVPVLMADQAALRLARNLCERALDDLGFDAGLVDRVRRLVTGEEGAFRSLECVAARIHLSARTLKRRLSAQGVSFSALVDRERREKALLLLRSSRLSIEDVAERLDYSTASSFVRAFHRWTGTTPAVYRRARRNGALPELGR